MFLLFHFLPFSFKFVFFNRTLIAFVFAERAKWAVLILLCMVFACSVDSHARVLLALCVWLL
jgi:hypothetical protein